MMQVSKTTLVRCKILKYIAICFLVSALLICLWFIFLYRSILYVGETASPEKSDVIIILGASVWQQGPSPALQARIEQGFSIYEEGLATYFISTGGLGAHPPTEAEAIMHELIDMGIESKYILLENRSASTYENLKFSIEIMNKHGFESAIIVTDVFHMKRALLIAQDMNIKATGSPSKDSPLYTNRDLLHRYTVREVLALSWYYSYRILN